MVYRGPSLDRVKSHQGVSGNYSNKQNINFKLFPFITGRAKYDVNSGCFLRRASGETVSKNEEGEGLAKQVIELIEDDIPNECHDLVYAAVRDITAAASSTDSNNLRIVLAEEGNTNAEKIAWYLVSMADDTDELRDITRIAIKQVDRNANLIERLIYKVVPLEPAKEKDDKPYFRGNTALSELFISDLEFVLSDTKLTDAYLEGLLNYYFFMSIAQNCMTIEQMTKGYRSTVHELYFALDWEKTTQGRMCYKQGFKILEPAIEDMFVHAGVLELLNTNAEEGQYDYIALKEIVNNDPELEKGVATNIRAATEECQELIGDPNLFVDLPKPEDQPASLDEEIEYLYRTIRTILFNTDRNKPRSEYSNSFRKYCQSELCFEKHRGRNGTMLNLTEDTLLLLTAISIGEDDALSLTDLFKCFESRGVFLDGLSREEVAKFFERRSMLDKKSDSGETQYVKRVL